MVCPKRKESDGSKDLSDKEFYRILVRLHKTRSSRRIELIWSKEFRAIVLNMISANGMEGDQVSVIQSMENSKSPFRIR